MTREWIDECGACLDTGWEEKRCYPGTANNCGRRKCATESVRPEHKYTVVCSCRETNHTFKRHHIGTKASYSEYT